MLYQIEEGGKIFKLNVEFNHEEGQLTEKSSQEVIKEALRQAISRVSDLNAVRELEVDFGNITIYPVTVNTEYLGDLKSIVPTNRNVFQNIAHAFKSFTRWIFRVPKSNNLKELEASFAMHLFRSVDDDIFETLIGKGSEKGEPKLTMSDTLKVWNHFFEEISTEGDEIATLLPSLKKLESYEKKLEEIRKIKVTSKRVSERQKLERKMLGDARQALEAEGGGTFYMPGGYINGVGDLVPMIYELSRDEQGNLQLSVIDLSATLLSGKEGEEEGVQEKRVNPSFSMPLDEREDLEETLKGIINKNLRAQVGPVPLPKKLNLIGKLKFLFSASAVSDEEVEKRVDIATSLTTAVKYDRVEAFEEFVGMFNNWNNLIQQAKNNALMKGELLKTENLAEQDFNDIEDLALALKITSEQLAEFLGFDSFNALKGHIAEQQYLKFQELGFDDIDALIAEANARGIEYLNALKDLLGTLQFEKLEELKGLAQKLSGIEPHTIKKQKGVEPEKLMEVFLKTKYPDVYQAKKTLLKISSFLALYKQTGSKLDDPEVRLWMRANATALLESVEKVENSLSDEDLTFLREQLTNILNDLEIRDLQAPSVLPPSPKKQKATPTKFSQEVGLSHVTKASSFKTMAVTLERADPLSKITTETLESPDDTLVFLQEQFALIRESVDNKEWKKSEMLIEDFSQQLREVQKRMEVDPLEDGWEALTDSKKWSTLIHDFGFLAAQTSYGLGFVAPKPNFIHYLLQSVAMQNLLCYQYEETEIFKEYAIDITAIEQVLRDPYLNLGAIGEEIERDLAVIARLDEKVHEGVEDEDAYLPSQLRGSHENRVDLSLTITPSNFYNTLDLKLFINDSHEDFGQKGDVPQEITDMRQLYQMTLTLLAPTRVLRKTGLSAVAIRRNLGDDLGEGVSIEERVQIAKAQKVVDKVQTTQGKISFSSKGQNDIRMEPWGLQVMGFNEIDIMDGSEKGNRFISFKGYQQQGTSIHDKKVEKTLFETNIGEESGIKVTDEGKAPRYNNVIEEDWSQENFPKVVAANRDREYGLQGKTERFIMHEELILMGLPSELVQEFQLMQTGDATRLKQTVGKLCKHAGLLNDGKSSPVLRRLFERNFTRNNLMIHTLINDPDYAPVLIESLQEAALGQKDAHQYGSYLFLSNLLHEVYDALDVVYESVSEEKQGMIDEQKEKLRTTLETLQHDLNDLQKKADSKAEPYLSYQNDFHFHNLLFLAKELKRSGGEPPIIDALKSYCLLNTSPDKGGLPPDQQFQVDHLMHQLGPHISALLENKEECNAVGNALLQTLKPGEEEREWSVSETDPLILKSGPYTLNLGEGTLWKDNVREAPLPVNIIKHPTFEKIAAALKDGGFEEDLSTTTMAITPIESKEEVGYQYAFQMKSETGETRDFRLVFTTSNAIRFYRQCNGDWEQFQEDIATVKSRTSKEQEESPLLKGETDALPQALNRYTCWVNFNQKVFRAEEKGRVIFSGLMRGSPKKVIAMREETTGRVLRNPWKEKQFSIFKNLEDPMHLLALGKRDCIDEIKYNRFNLSYKWDPKKEEWASPQHQHYHLSGKTLAQCFASVDEPGASVPPEKVFPLEELFSGTFTDYQLLESDRGHPKVLLTATKYKSASIDEKDKTIRLKKKGRKMERELAPEADSLSLFTYTADPRKGMVCDDVPDGYLYLSYVLLSQGKYDSALRYLQKGDIGRPLSDQGQEIVDWINSTADTSPEAIAVKMHLSLLLMRQSTFNQPGAKQSDAMQLATAEMAEQYREYKALVKEGKIKEGLQLSPNDVKDFKRFREKSLHYLAEKLMNHKEEILSIIHEAYNNKTKSLDSVIVSESIKQNPKLQKMHLNIGDLYDCCDAKLFQKDVSFEEFKQNLIDLNEKSQTRVNASYRAEIKELEQAILDRESAMENRADALPLTATPPEKPIMGTYYQQFFETKESANAQLEARVDSFTNAMNELEDPYANRVGGELADDLAGEVGEAGKNVLKPGRIQGFLVEVTRGEQQHIREANAHKQKFLSMLPEPSLRESRWQALINQAREQNTTREQILFDTALRCAGEDNWKPLEDLFPGQDLPIEELQEACRSYLKEAVQTQQYTRTKQLLHEIKELELGSLQYIKKSDDIYAATQTKWAYNPDEDVDAFTLLLIEYELGFVCRESQVNVVRASLHEDNQFKQEICGGGKTTVLRNIIAHWHANGVNLSAVSTLSPLRQEHGLLFSRTTSHAFGQRSFDFVFNRKTPSDEASLLKLHRNLLKTIVDRGRVDLTKEDLLSFKLEMVLKQERLIGLDPESDEAYAINREIDVMENIRDLLKTRAKINADELDKDCDVTQEKNYAHGERGGFTLEKQEAGLELFETILTADKEATPALGALMEAIRENKHSDLSEEEAAEAIEELAGQVFNKYSVDLNINDDQKEPFIRYMTTKDSDSDLVSFFNEHINPEKNQGSRDARNKICFMHEFMTQIIPDSLSKKGGVNYCRSEDLVHVIPSAGNDAPKEGSEHAQESEQIWYALLDYADLSRELGGVSEEQINQLIYNCRKDALKEVQKSRREDPDHPIAFEDTKVAIKFQEDFGRPLSEVSEKNFKEIADTIASNPKQLVKFMRNRVFCEYQQTTEKIVADAQDPPSMVSSYSGSSGTDLAKDSLPDQINTKDARQPGVHGKVIRSLIEIDKALQNEGVSSFLTYIEPPTIEWEEGILNSDFSKLKPGDTVYNLQQMINQHIGEDEEAPSLYAIAKAISQQHPGLPIDYINEKGHSTRYNPLPGVKAIKIAYTPPKGAPISLLQTLAKEIKGGDCLSDVGVAFPGISSVDLARSLQQLKPNLTIRFMNRENEWKMLVNGKVTSVDPNIKKEKVFTIFDDTHTRGAERPSMSNVTEYVTISTDTDLSKFEQGVLRERGVTKGEARVRYLIAPALLEKWRTEGKEPSLENLFQTIVSNETEKLKTLNMKGEKQKIQAISRHAIEESLREMSQEVRAVGDESHHEARAIIHEYTRHYFVRSTTASAASAGHPLGMINSEEFLINLVEAEVEKLRALIDALEKEIEEGKDPEGHIGLFIEKLAEAAFPKLEAKMDVSEEGGRTSPELLPGTVSNRDSELGDCVEQEMEAEMEVEQEMEVEMDIQGVPAFRDIPHQPLFYHILMGGSVFQGAQNINHFLDLILRDEETVYSGYDKMPKAQYLKLHYKDKHPDQFHSCKEYLSPEFKNKVFTNNFCPVNEGASINEHHTISRTLFVVDNTGDFPSVKEVYVSLKDLDDLEEFIQEHADEEGITLSIYNYDIGEVGRVDSGYPFENYDAGTAEAIRHEIVLTKFRSGKVDYSSFKGDTGNEAKNILFNEYDALLEWISNRNPEEIEALEAEFKENLKTQNPSARYEGSDIQKAFKEAYKRAST